MNNTKNTDPKFYFCSICKNQIEIIDASGATPFCCGKQMWQLLPNSSDGKAETHIPVAEREGNMLIVRVGNDAHPMTEQHYIKWIAVETDNGIFRKYLAVDTEPSELFALLDGDHVKAVYAYCNIHGLFKAEM